MIRALKADLGDKVSTSPSVLEGHGRDENYPLVHPPLAVVFVTSVADVQATLAWAREHHIAVIPFGAGTSLEGNVVPQGPSISLDLSRMNRVLTVRPADFLAIVEPGITRTALHAALRDTGLFFPVDPGADASIGGMAATNASGTTTVRYGGMRQNVAALEVVLANGEVLQLGRGVRKTSSGYDLKGLFIGSAGTLGVITQLTLHLHPIPEHIHTMRIFFSDVAQAAEAAYAIMAAALPVARLELLDTLSMQAVNSHLNRSYAEQPALFLEFHSSTQKAIEAEAQVATELAQQAGATSIDLARTQEDRLAQWEARHNLYWAVSHRYPNRTYVVTDTAVPLSALPDLVRFTGELMAELHLEGSMIGHAGDGNIHTLVAVRREEYQQAEELSNRLVERALSLGGTVTGEHGIGVTKRRFMAAEHGPALPWMRQIKALFDPECILNPGKIV